MKTINEKAREIMNNINFTELHKTLVRTDQKVWVYRDGKISIQTSGTIPNPNNERQPILILDSRSYDIWNSDYFEGWGHFDEADESENIFITDDGRKLTREEAVMECIEEGDWTEWREEFEEEIIRELEQEREYQEQKELEKAAQEEYEKSYIN